MTESGNEGKHRELLIALRRIIRAIDLHSRSLTQRFGLTGPQLIILEELTRRGEISVGELSSAISLSMATVTGIISRLEKRGLVRRRRDEDDRRKVLLTVTPACTDLLKDAPPPLQESFVAEYDRLEPWEQSLMLSSLQRIVAMMEASGLDATPMLTTGAIDAAPESSD
jgi:DNA-binding MarR family transcriptional regulator